MQFLGKNASLNSRVINLAGNATIDASGWSTSDPLYLNASPNSITATGQALTLTGTSTVGGEVGTAMSLGAGSVTKNGPGTWAFDVANTYSGGTNVNAGLLVSGANGALGTGPVSISGGTLDVSAAAQTVGSLTVGSQGTLNLLLTNTLTSTGSASLNGTLNLFGTTSGTEELISFPASYSGSFSTATNIPGYKLLYTPTQLDLVVAGNNSVLGVSTTTVNLSRMLTEAPQTQTVTVGQVGGSNSTGFSLAASGQVTYSGASGTAAGAIGGSTSGSFMAGVANSLGTNSGTLTVTNLGDDGNGTTGSAGAGQGSAQPPINVVVTGTVIDNRTVTAAPVSFGLVHAGAAVSGSFSLSTTGPDSQYTRLTVDNGTQDGYGMSVSGGTTTLFNDGSVVDNGRTLSGTLVTAGSLNTTINLASHGENLPGKIDQPVSLTYTANVFSGSGRWTGTNGGTSWGGSNSTNWTDANNSGVRAGPGMFQSFNDTAIFDDTGSTNSITLDRASPTLAALVFSTTSGKSCTLAQGSGGTLNLNNGSNAASVTVLSGTHAISAPITLSSSGSFGPTLGTQLTLSGDISDGGNGLSLSLTDSGTLILSGTNNTYSGGTYVESGTLYVQNSGALPDGSSLTVGAGGTFIFDPTVTGASMDATALHVASQINPVPEPGTIALLLAALWSAAVYRRFCRRSKWVPSAEELPYCRGSLRASETHFSRPIPVFPRTGKVLVHSPAPAFHRAWIGAPACGSRQPVFH